MARALRGEIRWAELAETRGREQTGPRPVLILSHDVFNDRSETAIAMAITSSPQRVGYPLTWQIPDGLLPRPSWVKVSQLRTLSTQRIGRPIAKLDDEQMDELVSALLELVG
ncbi:MAG: type II toxin-antitoxin system PemK/MazF family toxin [Chloroflexi bacterium]|nr:MAG: type II toxin-antitoxin system PemK/MazF family toxin [Chloroflexota bacterium]TMF64416.1 MAG: type II toxin-antitoxin system PemK/MazF family toxin [Chloroflexota bacterium]TMG35144.1 MAG: type II toxin-antitoxin system PemK/MazF family toxin [Chloroflexota bacterium]TMG40116.1 MAG: type II toxin-antitoxin system PemK/MazF family toxin [Chloroflexota bacterium]